MDLDVPTRYFEPSCRLVQNMYTDKNVVPYCRCVEKGIPTQKSDQRVIRTEEGLVQIGNIGPPRSSEYRINRGRSTRTWSYKLNYLFLVQGLFLNLYWDCLMQWRTELMRYWKGDANRAVVSGLENKTTQRECFDCSIRDIDQIVNIKVDWCRNLFYKSREKVNEKVKWSPHKIGMVISQHFMAFPTRFSSGFFPILLFSETSLLVLPALLVVVTVLIEPLEVISCFVTIPIQIVSGLEQAGNLNKAPYLSTKSTRTSKCLCILFFSTQKSQKLDRIGAPGWTLRDFSSILWQIIKKWKKVTQWQPYGYIAISTSHRGRCKNITQMVSS